MGSGGDLERVCIMEYCIIKPAIYMHVAAIYSKLL